VAVRIMYILFIRNFKIMKLQMSVVLLINAAFIIIKIRLLAKVFIILVDFLQISYY